MKVWFEGSTDIDCSIDDVNTSTDDLAAHFVAVTRRMPGLSKVELIERLGDAVTIRTNEGTMKRTNIVRHADAESVTVEFDEAYEAGTMMTSRAHFVDTFTASGRGVEYRIAVRDLEASGFLGIFYKTFAKSSMKRAFLNAQKAHLEASNDAPA